MSMPSQPPELKLHTDRIKFGGKILYQDEKITVVPCVLMAEGVQNGALKPFEEFYDPEGLEGALWFEGVPIVREHPASWVYHLTPKIGKVRNVQFDVDNRRVIAEAVLFNDRLTPEERKKIENGEQLGGSIGFWCEDEPIDAAETWADGTEYNVIQRAPFFGDHFALVQDPACPVGICGFNVESSHDDCRCKKKQEMNVLPDDGKAAAAAQPVIEEKPPAGDPKPPAGDAKKTLDLAPKADAIDMQTLKVKAKTILEMSDDYAKRNEALALLMEIVTEEGPVPAMQSKTTAKVVEMDSKLTERLGAIESKLDSQKDEIAELKEEKKAREAAIRADLDAKTSAALKANFDQAYQMEWEKHWPEIQKNGINAFLANPEHAKHWDVRGDKKQIDPVGQGFVPHGDDLGGANIASVESLSKRFYPGATAEKGGK